MACSLPVGHDHFPAPLPFLSLLWAWCGLYHLLCEACWTACRETAFLSPLCPLSTLTLLILLLRIGGPAGTFVARFFGVSPSGCLSVCLHFPPLSCGHRRLPRGVSPEVHSALAALCVLSRGCRKEHGKSQFAARETRPERKVRRNNIDLGFNALGRITMLCRGRTKGSRDALKVTSVVPFTKGTQ